MSPKKWSVNSFLQTTEKVPFAPLLNQDDDAEHQRDPVKALPAQRFHTGNVILFAASLCCLIASGALFLESGENSNILRQMTFYSPVVDNFSPEWHPDPYVTHPLDSEESIYRQDPSDEVDAAWDRISKIGVLAISINDVRGLEKDPSTVAKAPESWNLGSDAHLAHLDGLHLLHCLNALRKTIHHNFDRYYPDGIPAVHHAHLSHCQEALAKHLMCQPSVEMITYSWAEGQEHPFPDFDMTRKCYGVEQLLEWQEKHQVAEMEHAKWNQLRQPEDITPLPVPLLMQESFNASRKEGDLLA